MNAIYERLFYDIKCPVPGCTLPIDLVLSERSIDWVLYEPSLYLKPYSAQRFGTHKKNLEIFNDSETFKHDLAHFLDANRNPPQAYLPITPKSLELLLRFSHDHALPDLRLEKDVEDVYNFSMYAEMYGNKVAQRACKSALEYLGKRSPKDAIFALGYKSDNHLFSGIDEYARRSMSLTFEDVERPLAIASSLRTFKKNHVIWKHYKDEWDRFMHKYITAVQNLITSKIEYGKIKIIPGILHLIRTELESEVALTSETVGRTLDIVWEIEGSGELEKGIDVDGARRVLEQILGERPSWEQLAMEYEYIDV
ncbi:hypothetical protein VNI00_003757 [Paramarasmius palmivorus]|uniref:Uncharacterized protein n=1 Tax=Paramarasmius palmivorus TaxID=297713 RepID=A0AAW0DSB0_9AGAR